MESWRILLHIAALKGWDVQQINVKTAFLYGLLPDDETQYMQQPMGFEEQGRETWVWHLKRGLYGIKQSGQIWNQTMNDAMLTWGFKCLSSKSCIYYHSQSEGCVIAAVHIDNFLSIASHPSENAHFKTQMRTIWTISNLGEPKFCVGIGIQHNLSTNMVYLSQVALIDRVVVQFGQSDVHPSPCQWTPD